MLWTKERGELDLRMLREQIRDVPNLSVHGCRIADEADAFAVQGIRREQTLASKVYSHGDMVRQSFVFRPWCLVRPWSLWAVRDMGNTLVQRHG